MPDQPTARPTVKSETIRLVTLLRKIEIRDFHECWTYRGSLSTNGYGLHRTHVNGKDISVLAHRASYEHFIGPIPDGKQLDHVCRNRPCANPWHLEPVSARENLLRSPLTLASINAAKTHCVHGHPFSGENLCIRSDGTRGCRTCDLDKSRRYEAKRRASGRTRA